MHVLPILVTSKLMYYICVVIGQLVSEWLNIMVYQSVGGGWGGGTKSPEFSYIYEISFKEQSIQKGMPKHTL